MTVKSITIAIAGLVLLLAGPPAVGGEYFDIQENDSANSTGGLTTQLGREFLTPGRNFLTPGRNYTTPGRAYTTPGRIVPGPRKPDARKPDARKPVPQKSEAVDLNGPIGAIQVLNPTGNNFVSLCFVRPISGRILCWNGHW